MRGEIQFNVANVAAGEIGKRASNPFRPALCELSTTLLDRLGYVSRLRDLAPAFTVPGRLPTPELCANVKRRLGRSLLQLAAFNFN